jgi:hypothetical protein
MTFPDIPYTLLQAIAREEGFYDEDVIPNRPQRNNNPGDLEWRPWMTTYGSMEGDPRFAIFPSADLGFQALRHLLQFPLYKGKTISQAISIFAPGNENNVQSYVLNVCSWTEQQPNTVIDGILG